MEQDLKYILGQIVDNQFELNKKIDTVIKLISDLTNTIIKYDQEYQNEIIKDLGE